MNGLEEIKNPISCTFNKATGVKKYEYTEAQVNAIEKELKDKEKKDKALEIFKEKLVDIDLFFYCANRSMYNNRVNIGKQLTYEEYDLLKEVLL